MAGRDRRLSVSDTQEHYYIEYRPINFGKVGDGDTAYRGKLLNAQPES